MSTTERRPRGRPRAEDSPVSTEDILRAALKAFATHGYEGVSVRTLNRELGVSHSLISARFGSKEDLWYATVDWAYAPLANRVASAFDPTLTDPLDQLRLAVRTFLVYSAEQPELLGLMNIEARQDTERLSYIFNTYIVTGLAPLARLFDPTDPLDPMAVEEHAALNADLIVRALEVDPATDSKGAGAA